MWNIFRIITGCIAFLAVSSCGEQYNPLPPKTDASIQYALPRPEKPSQDEIDKLLKIRKEHEDATR